MKHIHVPLAGSHKGQNGRLLLIGGSRLFHAASIWSLTVASRIVDLVHYASVPENNELIKEAKKEFRNGIVIERKDIESYIKEDDCILIGPGMVRDEETRTLTNRLLKAYPNKQWVIDAGALQMMDISLIPKHAVLTPHLKEFESLIIRAEVANQNFRVLRSPLINSGAPSAQGSNFHSLPARKKAVAWFAKKYHCIVLLKGEKDIVSDGEETHTIAGGNAGMTKGGTGDVLAGLIAALCCTNDPSVSTIVGSRINKQAGDELYKSVGPYFNATDLANQIPKTMKEFLQIK